MFSAHSASEKLEKAKIIGHFGFVFEGKLWQGNHVVVVTLSFLKSLKYFPSNLRRKEGFFKLIRL